MVGTSPTLSFQVDFDPTKSKAPYTDPLQRLMSMDPLQRSMIMNLVSDGNDDGVRQASSADSQIARGLGPIDGRALEEFIKLIQQEQWEANIKA